MTSYVKRHMLNNELIVAEAQNSKTGLIIGIIMCCLIILLPWGIILIMQYYNSELTVTTKRVVGKIGLNGFKVLNVPIDKIQCVKLEVSFLGKIFKYGTIRIYSAKGSFHWSHICDAEIFSVFILNQIANYKV